MQRRAPQLSRTELCSVSESCLPASRSIPAILMDPAMDMPSIFMPVLHSPHRKTHTLTAVCELRSNARANSVMKARRIKASAYYLSDSANKLTAHQPQTCPALLSRSCSSDVLQDTFRCAARLLRRQSTPLPPPRLVRHTAPLS